MTSKIPPVRLNGEYLGHKELNAGRGIFRRLGMGEDWEVDYRLRGRMGSENIAG
jgi:hypothetical protein